MATMHDRELEEKIKGMKLNLGPSNTLSSPNCKVTRLQIQNEKATIQGISIRIPLLKCIRSSIMGYFNWYDQNYFKTKDPKINIA